jgi:hypothetical protein
MMEFEIFFLYSPSHGITNMKKTHCEGAWHCFRLVQIAKESNK